jgi:hypothetical protein
MWRVCGKLRVELSNFGNLSRELEDSVGIKGHYFRDLTEPGKSEFESLAEPGLRNSQGQPRSR